MYICYVLAKIQMVTKQTPSANRTPKCYVLAKIQMVTKLIDSSIIS